MVFNAELIGVSKTTEKYTNLSYNEKGTITFAVKDAYSHFGVSYNKKFKNYSIGLNINDKLFDNLKAVEEKAKTFVSDRTLSKPLLRSLVEKDGYANLYLKLKGDEFDEEMLDVKKRDGECTNYGYGNLQRVRSPVVTRVRRRNISFEGSAAFQTRSGSD